VPAGTVRAVTSLDHVGLLSAAGHRCAELLLDVPGDAPLPHLPGWTVTDVGQHLAGDFVWATRTIRQRRMPRAGIRPVRAAGPALAAELHRLTEEMADALREAQADPEGRCPNFAEGTAGRLGWWPRHQAFETVLHRWDLEVPTGRHAPVDPWFAADGVDELLHVYTRRYRPHRLTVPLDLRCVDGPATGWRVLPEGDDGRVGVDRLGPGSGDPPPGAVVVAGDGVALLLTLWRRLDPAAAGVTVTGDGQVLRDFLTGPVTA
jgi:uncharacterized protein (TIGR03083 family)